MAGGEASSEHVVLCAEVAAHLHGFSAVPQAEVLEPLGLSVATWMQLCAEWVRARRTEIDAGENALTRRYGSAFAKCLRQLQTDRPTLASLRPLHLQASAGPLQRIQPPVAAAPPVAISPGPVSPAPPSVSSPPIPPPSVRPSAALAETSGVVVVAVQVMPFVAPSSPEEAFERALRYAQAVQGARPNIRASVGGTVGIDVASATGAPQGPPEQPRLPSSMPPSSSQRPCEIAGVSVREYAALRVERQLFPAEGARAYARQGLTEDQGPELDAHFRAMFERDPAMRMAFAKAYAEYIAWFRSHGGDTSR